MFKTISLIVGMYMGVWFFISSAQNPLSLKVLFWVGAFPTNTGGSTLNQIIGFLEKGHDVTIVTQELHDHSINNNHPDIIAYDIMSKVFVQSIPKDKKDFDIIVCQSAGLAIPLLEFKKNNNIHGALIVFVRGADLKVFFDKKIGKHIIDNFNIIAPVCNYFKNELEKLYTSKKIKVLHSSIDCKKFAYKKHIFNKKEIRIVTTSRLAHKKGLDYALHAIAFLVRKYPYVQYTIIGDGRLKNELEKLIAQLHLEKNVCLVGWKSPDEIIAILEHSDIFVLPSVTRNAQEGIPNALKEAMAVGVPVISTWHAGIPELIEDGVTGFLVPEKDSRALAEKMIFLIEHPEQWQSLTTAARTYVEQHFERTKENAQLHTVCYELIKKNV